MPTALEIVQEQTIRKLREQIEALEEELRQCRQMMTSSVPFPAWMPHLTPTEEKVLRHLMSRDMVDYDGINYVLYGNDVDMRGEDMPKIWVCKLRRKIEPVGIIIETAWGKGYKLPKQFRDLLSDPLAPPPALSISPTGDHAYERDERDEVGPSTGLVA